MILHIYYNKEVIGAIKRMSDGKAPGYDSITAEELKASGESGTDILHKLCNLIWRKESFPTDWGRAIITPIFKKKDKLDCGNYRGISLLSHAGKIFASILQRRILKKTEEILSESQAGFRPGRSTIDQLFTLRQIAKKHLEKNRSLFCCYIDFEKAFDSIWQEGLWKAMRFFGYSNKHICLLKALYKISASAVRVNGELTDWFPTTVGVRQGCVLSPQLFNIILEMVMLHATYDSPIGINIQGHLINNLRFADGIVLLVCNEIDLQSIVDCVQQWSSNFGLKINIAKTEVQVISKQQQDINISIGGTKLLQVEKLVYLGGTITQSGKCTEDINNRIGKALGAVQSLHSILTAKDIRDVLMYGSETWTLKKEDENRLLTFEMICLRKILGVTRLDRIRNTTIRKTLGLDETILDKIAIQRLRFFGHVNRMRPSRYPKILLTSDIHGDRPRGRPAKTWIYCVKADCATRCLGSLTEATRTSQDRKIWLDVMKQKPSHISQMVQKA